MKDPTKVVWFLMLWVIEHGRLDTREEGVCLEKGTDCGPIAAELWLSRANNAKKGELSSHYR